MKKDNSNVSHGHLSYILICSSWWSHQWAPSLWLVISLSSPLPDSCRLLVISQWRCFCSCLSLGFSWGSMSNTDTCVIRPLFSSFWKRINIVTLCLRSMCRVIAYPILKGGKWFDLVNKGEFLKLLKLQVKTDFLYNSLQFVYNLQFDCQI